MPSIPVGLQTALATQRRAIFIILLSALFSARGKSASVASQDFGELQVGSLSTLSVAVPAVTPGPATISMRYSIDFSLGACTPNANGCAAAVTFNPTKPGLRQDAVVVKDANGQIVEEVFLHGVGLGPLPVFSPAIATLKARLQYADYIREIVSAPDGKFFVITGVAANAIYEFDPVTNSLAAVPGLPTASAYAPSFNGLAIDAAGNIYYATYSFIAPFGIHRLDSITGVDSVLVSNVSAGPMIVSPIGMIFYVAGDQIFKMDPNTKSITLVAGDGIHGYGGDGGPAVNAHFSYPAGIALDLAGNLYIADSANQRVRKVDRFGVISTIAGTGTIANTGDGGPAVNAGLDFPSWLAADAAGDLYISAGSIRRVDAGTGLISSISGGGTSSNSDPFLGVGFSASTRDVSLSGVTTLDGDGNLWVGNNGLYEISSSTSTIRFPFTAAGQTQTQTVSLLNAGTADLSQLVLGATGQNREDFSTSNDCSGRLAKGGICNISVSFTAGSHATSVAAVTVADNAISSPQTIPVSGASGARLPAIQQIAAVPVGSSSATPQTVSIQFPGNASGLTAVLAYGTEFNLGQLSCSGTGTVSCTIPVRFAPLYPGPRQDAIQFLDSSGSAVYQCSLSGEGQAAQWFVDPGVIGSIPMPNSAKLSALDPVGNLYATSGAGFGFGPPDSSIVYRFNLQTSQWTIVAGQAVGGVDTGDGGPATSATLSYVNAVALDPAGNMYIAETFKIRRVDARSGIITTVAQEGGGSIAIDNHGYVYFLNISDKVRKLDPSNGNIVDFAGNGQLALTSNGDGGPATAASFFEPEAIAFDNAGNLLITEYYRVRKVDSNSGIITTYAYFCGSNSISLDAAGDVYLACGELALVPPGPGTPHFVQTQNLYNIAGPLLRHPGGTIYTSNGITLSPALRSPLYLNTVILNGSPSTSTVGLTNAGNTPLALKAVALSGPDAAAFSQGNTCGPSLAPAQNCTLSLTFAPVKAGKSTASLRVSSSLSDLQADLSGMAVVPSIQYSPNNLTFGNVQISLASVRLVGLFNDGLYPVGISGVSISGQSAAAFSVQSACPATLLTYQSCNLVVTFHPAALGISAGDLTIADNAAGSPHIVPLTGTGVPASAAVWAGSDTATQGTWTGKYGGDAQIIPGGINQQPSYGSVSQIGASTYVWTGSTTDARALQASSGATGRIASTFYDGNNFAAGSKFSIDVNLIDGNKHRLALYLCDWDHWGRSETISILDANTQAVLSTQTFSGFDGGVYALWNVNGHVMIQVTNNGATSINSLLNGIFLDSGNAAAASYLGPDTTTQGAWTGKYGGDAQIIPAGINHQPSYGSVAQAGASTFVWTDSTTDARALQTSGDATTRIASTFYDGNSFVAIQTRINKGT
jgi:sugar lactone lactonase YvrE